MTKPIAHGDMGTVAETEITDRVLALVRKMAADPAGGGSAGMRAVDNLQGHAEREAYLREMVMCFQPPEADPEIWLRWLSGGAAPFAPRVPQKPRFSQANTKREIERTSKRVGAARERIAKAERELAAARSAAASELELESSLIAWALMQQITSLVTPIFAMGPAWTVMRVVSPYISDDEMKEELILEDHEPARQSLEKTVRQERLETSNTILSALDFWSGNLEFEHDLRKSIKSVADKYKNQEANKPKEGRKVRSQNAMKHSVRQDSTKYSHEILSNLKNNRSAL